MKLNKKVVAGVAAIALAISAATGFTLAYFTDSTQEDTNVITMGHVDITLDETSDPENTVYEGEEYDDMTILPGVPVDDHGEEVDGPDDPDFDGFAFGDVMPGDVYAKMPVVTVVDDDPNTQDVDEASQPAFIRVMLTLTVTDPDENNADNEDLDVTARELLGMLDIDDALWNVVDEDDTGMPGTLVVYAYYDPAAADLRDGILNPGESATVFTIVDFPFEMDNNNTDDGYTIDIMAEAIQAQNFTPISNDGDGRVDSWGIVDIEEYIAP